MKEVLERTGRRTAQRSAYWLCRCCECGRLFEISANAIKIQESCGCLRGPPIQHGHAQGKPTSTYSTWKAMRGRCNNPRNSSYGRYGGRGIKVCEHWDSFENFLTAMGEKPGPEYSIDRINNDGDYEPDNCRWATGKEQCNNRSDNK